LDASEQSSSCLLYACKGNVPAGFYLWEHTETLQAFKAFLNKSSGAWEVPYKWGGRDREWWGIAPIWRDTRSFHTAALLQLLSPKSYSAPNPDLWICSELLYMSTGWLMSTGAGRGWRDNLTFKGHPRRETSQQIIFKINGLKIEKFFMQTLEY